MTKKHQIYKRDKYNMLTVEVKGKTITLREISDQWGEDAHIFVSRQEMLHWVRNRFRPENFVGREEELEAIMNAFKEV